MKLWRVSVTGNVHYLCHWRECEQPLALVSDRHLLCRAASSRQSNPYFLGLKPLTHFVGDASPVETKFIFRIPQLRKTRICLCHIVISFHHLHRC